MQPDYQRPDGTPEPEGNTAGRSPFPGWLRNPHHGGWRWVNARLFKAAILLHQKDKRHHG